MADNIECVIKEVGVLLNTVKVPVNGYDYFAMTVKDIAKAVKKAIVKRDKLGRI